MKLERGKLKMIKIAPSILSADFANISDDIKKAVNGGADYIHCDVMDGVFVPNITFGPKMIKDIKAMTDVPLDVHLMIVKPEKYVGEFCKAGADIVTVHYEATPHVHRALQMIKDNGKKCGIVLNPGTPVDCIIDMLGYVDMVLLMSVNPGYGGQKFIPFVLDKLRCLSKIKRDKGYCFEIEVDGGVYAHNAAEIKDAGAEVLVAGNAIYGSKDHTPEEMIELIRKA